MKVIDALKQWENTGDFDVITGANCWRAYCGTKLTKTGKNRYKQVLNLPCEFSFKNGIWFLLVNIVDEREDNELERMLCDMAGNISPTLWERYFIDE